MTRKSKSGKIINQDLQKRKRKREDQGADNGHNADTTALALKKGLQKWRGEGVEQRVTGTACFWKIDNQKKASWA